MLGALFGGWKPLPLGDVVVVQGQLRKAVVATSSSRFTGPANSQSTQATGTPSRAMTFQGPVSQ